MIYTVKKCGISVIENDSNKTLLKYLIILYSITCQLYYCVSLIEVLTSKYVLSITNLLFISSFYPEAMQSEFTCNI